MQLSPPSLLLPPLPPVLSSSDNTHPPENSKFYLIPLSFELLYFKISVKGNLPTMSTHWLSFRLEHVYKAAAHLFSFSITNGWAAARASNFNESSEPILSIILECEAGFFPTVPFLESFPSFSVLQLKKTYLILGRSVGFPHFRPWTSKIEGFFSASFLPLLFLYIRHLRGMISGMAFQKCPSAF